MTKAHGEAEPAIECDPIMPSHQNAKGKKANVLFYQRMLRKNRRALGLTVAGVRSYVAARDQFFAPWRTLAMAIHLGHA